MTVLLSLFLFGAAALAGQFEDYIYSEPKYEFIYDTQSGRTLSLKEAAEALDENEIIVFGEEHVTAENQADPDARLHHDNQLRWLLAREMQLGMEFIEYPHQAVVDDYLGGHKAEREFLSAIGWGSNPFTPYGRLMRATRQQGTLALNIPRTISRQVARGGPQSLTPEQRALLPPIYERGGTEYFERFAATMSGHVPADAIERYFWAQSLWDDTMAWRAATGRIPGQILTIVVGQFHAEFGHGLPARLRRYGATKVRSLVQMQVESWDSATIQAALQPDPRYGHRADLIWLYQR